MDPACADGASDDERASHQEYACRRPAVEPFVGLSVIDRPAMGERCRRRCRARPRVPPSRLDEWRTSLTHPDVDCRAVATEWADTEYGGIASLADKAHRAPPLVLRIAFNRASGLLDVSSVMSDITGVGEVLDQHAPDRSPGSKTSSAPNPWRVSRGWPDVPSAITLRHIASAYWAMAGRDTESTGRQNAPDGIVSRPVIWECMPTR